MTTRTVPKICIQKDRVQVWKMSVQNRSYEYVKEKRYNRKVYNLDLLPWTAITKSRLAGEITALCDRSACF